MHSEWVKIEASFGRARGILVPVQFDNAPLPPTFRHVQTSSLVGWEGNDTAPELVSLMDGLSRILEGHGIERVCLLPALEQRALDTAIASELPVQ